MDRPRTSLDGLRVLYLCDHLGERGGAGAHLHQVIAAAVAAGARVRVACGRSGGGAMPGAASTRIRGLASAVQSRSRLEGVRELLAGCDLVHAQNLMNPAALAAVTGTGRAVVTVQDHRVLCPGPGKTLPDGRRCVAQMADDQCRACLPDDAYRRRMLVLTTERRESLRGARLVVLSRYMAGELAAAGLPGAAVVPPWVSVGDERRRSGDAFLLGGRLVEHKGVLEGWRAWRQAATPLPLRVAGEGPVASRLEGAELLGWLGPAALRRELRRARALLLPSRWQEPFGILAIEALAEGTPVIAVDRGGTDEWSSAGCLRVRPGDDRALADAVRALAADPDRALRMGREGQAAVAQAFGRDAVEPRLWRLYREVAAQEASGVGSM